MHRNAMADNAPYVDENARVASSMLQTKTAHLRAEVEQLRAENEKLRTEKEALLDENRDLRQEATLVRLYRAIGERTGSIRSDDPDTTSVPVPAANLYYHLPVSFKFADYFGHASSAGLDTKTARECLLYFLNERLLVQVGSRLRKTDIILRHVP